MCVCGEVLEGFRSTARARMRVWCKGRERLGGHTTKWHRACNLEALGGGGGGARVTGIMIHTHTLLSHHLLVTRKGYLFL